LTKRGDVKEDGSLKRSETIVFSRQKPRNPSGPLNRPNPDAFIKNHLSNINTQSHTKNKIFFQF
jgi:hypothetical protein